MEVNVPASHHFRFITGVTTPAGHWIMGWVGSRACPGFVERSVNELSMSVGLATAVAIVQCLPALHILL